ncbi:hypothetical protein MKW94_025128 [Papaver nudicaule]|uniref:Fe2OG dioxygenase domain-containing protein n=1 Tax=Papaver nudicaule TaxID=74823 RepID=A0AA42AQX8_PAPNU|nr:hypothetical protein [Papaver nudicaule]
METPKPLTLGSSLLVPSVQELAEQNLAEIPPRYIRTGGDQGCSAMISDASEIGGNIPVIDLQNLLSREQSIGDSELEKLHFACKEWGFFQLVNHGVSSSLVGKVKSEVYDLFKLPMEEKKKYWQHEGEIEGFGQAFVVSEEQKLDWADIFFMTTLPHHARKPHLFPKLPRPLKDTLESYSLQLKILAMTILGRMAKALLIESNFMTELFENGTQFMRMNYYPPCPQPERVIGLTSHSDAVGLTILLQLNEVEGLQIKKEDKWVPVKPLPDAFIINIGDILEIVTNGIYPSVDHKATVNSAKERLSVATFYSPNPEGIIRPAANLVTPQTPALFKSVGVEEYFKGLFTQKLEGKKYLDEMRIHPRESK